MSEKKRKKKYDYYKPALPRELQEEIESLINRFPHLGYRSTPEFIIDAIRSKLEEVEAKEREKRREKEKETKK